MLRRAGNLPLQVVAHCSGVSVSRASHILRAIERRISDSTMRRLLEQSRSSTEVFTPP